MTGETGILKPLVDPDIMPAAPPPEFGTDSDGGGSETSVSASLPVYSTTEIADFLLNGFWEGSGGARAFDVTAGDTLWVDLSQLRPDGQTMARLALDAWSDITGILFQEVNATGAGLAGEEGADAPATVATPYTLTVGEYFLGTIAADGDRDRIAITVSAGQAVTIALTADTWAGLSLVDPLLRLYDAAGTLIAENDDASGLNSVITFTPTVDGVIYAEAAAFGDFYTGGYRLSVSDDAIAPDITFGDQDSGAYASFVTSGGVIESTFVNVNYNWVGGGDRIDSYHYQTYLHEIGHALGLGHAGAYNGSAVWGVDNHYQNDSWQSTLMSYFDQRENDIVGGTFAFAVTPQAADIMAVRQLYGGAPLRAGDTVYGQDGTTGTYLDVLDTVSASVSWTVLDDGGTDTLNYSETWTNQQINLTPGATSNVLGLTGNLTIYDDSWIEHARTGAGRDGLKGNALANHLAAGAGHDVLTGGGGNDTLEGEDGIDLLLAGDGFNRLDGGAGGDLLIGSGLGPDEIAAILADHPDQVDAFWSDNLDFLA